VNSDLNKKDKSTCDASWRGVEGSLGAVGRRTCGGRPYGEQTYCTNYVNQLLLSEEIFEIGQIVDVDTVTCIIDHMY
jgi:hypothetical protein